MFDEERNIKGKAILCAYLDDVCFPYKWESKGVGWGRPILGLCTKRLWLVDNVVGL